MSIFGSKFQNDLPFKEGEYQATMLRTDWQDTKAGDPMMIVEFRTDEGRTGKAMFPQVNPFFEEQAKQACEVLLGVAEPEDFETFFKLADQRASRARFTLVVKTHQKPDGNTTQNFLVREAEVKVDEGMSELNHRLRKQAKDRLDKYRRKAEDKAFEPAWAGQEEA